MICGSCGNGFLGTPTRSKCSACSRVGKRVPRVKTCLRCKNEFSTRQHNVTSHCLDCHKVVARESMLATLNGRVESCRNCRECFSPTSHCQVFCSKSCNLTWWTMRRRVRLDSSFIEGVSLKYVFRKCNGICQLCQQPVDPTISRKTSTPMMGTIDHIIPITKGGKHERANVQLAHFGCNSRKRNLLPGESRKAVQNG